MQLSSAKMAAILSRGNELTNDSLVSIHASFSLNESMQIAVTFHWIHSKVFRKHVLGFLSMITSSNETIFRATGHLRGESTGYQWIHLTNYRDAGDLDAIALIMTSM